jgi:hypothetical protein
VTHYSRFANQAYCAVEGGRPTWAEHSRSGSLAEVTCPDCLRLLAQRNGDKQEVRVRYRNHRGVTGTRRLIPLETWFGETEFHQGEQWFLKAFDCDKEVIRHFSLDGIRMWMRGPFGATMEDPA